MRDHGYMMVDHRASPGFTEEEARIAGYDPLQCKEGKIFESKTFCCAHCKTHVVPNPTRIRPRESCAKCSFHYICDGCAFLASMPDYVHTPAVRVQDVLHSDNTTLKLSLIGEKHVQVPLLVP